MKTAIIIPCYNVKKHILNVLKSISNDLYKIYVIDDGCPEKTGDFLTI